MHRNKVTVKVSNDLLTGPVTFEEASAGDCVGNFTVGKLQVTSGMFSCIDVVVTFSSSTMASLATWFLPTLFLVFASWLHFWIHGSWSVPRTISAALPFFIFAVIFVSVCISSFISQQVEGQSFPLSHDGQNLKNLKSENLKRPSQSEKAFIDRLSSLLGHQRSGFQTLEVAYNTKCASFRNNNGVDVIARLLFPLVFIIFLIIYLVFLI
ncbi:unnamed protein product [Haemonchus placei]|uniref:Neur_chan_memb domain-containing protein n=1 Tax=Haemonchus placei TaxID=6290 RepID=A0A158QRU8_HAEPC|nr:unnamed protein product [Haemonchus placei]